MNTPKNPAERRAWIKYQLEMRGLSVRRLALREGVSQQAMSHALIGPSSHLQPVIAKAIGMAVQELFPEFYDEHGNRLGRTREKQRTTRNINCNVKNREAA
jgi:Ner family transcriptional regulator